jgi:hypothetical protein
VLQKISETPVDDKGLTTARVEIRTVTIRATPPEPFVTETPQELGTYRGVLDTSSGPITIEFFPTRRRIPSASSCGSPRPACTTAWRSIASRPVS